MSAWIFGATSRVGEALARHWAQRGYDIVLSARRREEAEAIASDIALRFRVRAHVLVLDATDIDGHEAAILAMAASSGAIDHAALVFGDMGDQEGSQADSAAAAHVINVNYTGAVSICETLAALMIEQGSGNIIGVSSVAGDRGRASNYIYGSAKGAFTLYLQGLRNRLHEHGVGVLTVKLGFVDTRMTWALQSGLPKATPEASAAAIAAAVERGENVMYYPRFWAGIMGIIRAIPEPIYKRLKIG